VLLDGSLLANRPGGTAPKRFARARACSSGGKHRYHHECDR
jgi:hypothetical protein